MKPDQAAASYEPHWRGESLPEPGREIVMRCFFEDSGRTHWREYRDTVEAVQLDPLRDARLTITLPGDPTRYLLDADNTTCWWRYSRPAGNRPTAAEMNEALAEQIAEDNEALRLEQIQQDREAVAGPAMPPAHDETMVGRLRRALAVQNRITVLEAGLKALKAEKKKLDELIVDLMAESGMDSPPGVDGMTAYLAPVFYAVKQVDPDTGEPYTTEDVLTALRASKLDGMINAGYNGNSMRALLREYQTNRMDPPEPLAKIFELEKRREVRFTPMAAQRRRASPNRS